MQNVVQRYYGSINRVRMAGVDKHNSSNKARLQHILYMLVILLVKFTENCSCANNEQMKKSTCYKPFSTSNYYTANITQPRQPKDRTWRA